MNSQVCAQRSDQLTGPKDFQRRVCLGLRLIKHDQPDVVDGNNIPIKPQASKSAPSQRHQRQQGNHETVAMQ
jgi:hypothetical protein